ncbi:MAG: type II toxin-antitoxin system VapC family toxin [Gemmatimonadetes bacterium]|nr:type II toxin-antitoxin system VapC family toxin [Gemmatimonadota bacterium]
MLFLDSSALVKLYLAEDGTSTMRGIIHRRGGSLFVSDFIALEVLTAIRVALRKETAAVYATALTQFRIDFPGLFNLVDVDAVTRRLACDLTTRSRTTRARSMDLLHLAAALRLQARRTLSPVTMVTSDQDLADLSKQHGLRTFDPSREPLAALPRA